MSEGPAWLQDYVKPVLVAAHTDAQFRLFVIEQGIPRDSVRRLFDEVQIAARPARGGLLILLPGWPDRPQVRTAVHSWRYRGGEVVEASDAQVIGELPFDPRKVGEATYPEAAAKAFDLLLVTDRGRLIRLERVAGGHVFRSNWRDGGQHRSGWGDPKAIHPQAAAGLIEGALAVYARQEQGKAVG